MYIYIYIYTSTYRVRPCIWVCFLGPMNTNDDSRCIGQNLISVTSYILVPEVVGNTCALVSGLKKNARKISVPFGRLECLVHNVDSRPDLLDEENRMICIAIRSGPLAARNDDNHTSDTSNRRLH